jgi:hypothetical protein
MHRSLKGSYLFRFTVGQSMPGLSVPLMYPSISPYLSLRTLGSLVMGFPFFSFLIVATKSKRIRVIP